MSNYFTRLQTGEQVREVLQDLAFRYNAEADLTDPSFLRVYAPDGDEVFVAILKSEDFYICRYHREVFVE